MSKAIALLGVKTPAQTTKALQLQEASRVIANTPSNDVFMTDLAAFVRSEFTIMRDHRNTQAGWRDRMVDAQRRFNGDYPPNVLAEIRQFGGSEQYVGLIAQKCRGASSMLRELYTNPKDKPWGLDPSDDPKMPDDVVQAVKTIIAHEMDEATQAGAPMEDQDARARTSQLLDMAATALKKKARDQSKVAEDKINGYLQDGGFYHAVEQLLQDLPLFPFAAMCGPTVVIKPSIEWVDGQMKTVNKPVMTWERVSPFDLFFTPGVNDLAQANICLRRRYRRIDLNALIGVPGYDDAALKRCLDEYGNGGLRDWIDDTDSERAVQEGREDPFMNRSGMIDAMEFHGWVQGRMLQGFDMPGAGSIDPLMDYAVVCWVIGRHVIKVSVAPSPRQRHPFWITSFEKVPGTVVGKALPDMLGDIEDAYNATHRALLNNLAIASGPQVVINLDRLDGGDDAAQIYPWKRHYVTSDPNAANNTQKPIDFFQPTDNSQQLMAVLAYYSTLADDISAIPKYVSGSTSNLSGAGRTASGLSMLMGNASKLLQVVASNIDSDIIGPILLALYDMLMLTDETGLLRGDEDIVVRGVTVAMQRETDRQRQTEFLQMVSASPTALQIIGPDGFAEVLRSIADTIGLEGSVIVPDEDTLKARVAQQQQQALAAQQGAGPGGSGPAPLPSPAGEEQPGSVPGSPSPQGGSLPAPVSGAPGVAEGASMQGMTGHA